MIDRKKLLLWTMVVPLSIAMLACGGSGGSPASSSGTTGAGAGGGAAKPPEDKGKIELTSAGTTIVDPTKFPEPKEGTVGWIPPADLTATVKRGGTLRTNSGWTRLDPHFPIHAADGRFNLGLYGASLLRWDQKTGSPMLDMAESWTAAPDNLSYTFKLKKGIKFHNKPPVNGREVKAEDVKWSFDRLAGITRKPGQSSFNYARFDTVKEIQIVDDYTVKFIMKQPDNMIMRELAFDYSLVLPKEAAIDGEFSKGETLISAGPFMVEMAGTDGALSRFVRNPDYFDKGPENRPYLDAIELTAPSAQTLAPAFKTKQMDRAVSGWTTLKPVLSDKALEPELRVFSTKGNMVGISGVSVNPKVAPFTDIRVRKAFFIAIDRDEIINLVFDGPRGGYASTFLGGYWQPWFWTEEKLRSLPGYRQNKEEDYAEARKLLAEAGFADGLTVTCECEDQSRANVLLQQFKRIGVDMKINLQSAAIIRFTSYMKDKQMSDTTQGGLHTPDGALTQSYLCEAQKNQSAYCSQDVEKMWKEFRAAIDTEKAVKILQDIQQKLYDDVAFIPTTRTLTYHVAYKYVRGWRNGFYDVANAHGHEAVTWWMDK